MSELKGVFGHEMGHYRGGETRFALWVFRARQAILRAVNSFGSVNTLLRLPFVCYGKLFVAVTLATSRHQETAADAVAARVAGARAVAAGLRKTHGAAAAFDAYLANEVVPALNAGVRPPLADGFAGFLRDATVARITEELVRRETAEPTRDLSDTHPPLAHRLAALAGLPPGPDPSVDPPAISLLENVPARETEMFVALFGESRVGALTTVSWEQTAERVWLPGWREFARRHASGLRGRTPAALALLADDPAGLGYTLTDEVPSREEARRLAFRTVGAALCLALAERGWTIHAPPGARVRACRGSLELEPFEVLPRLAERQLDPDAWAQLAAQAGIADVDLATRVG